MTNTEQRVELTVWQRCMRSGQLTQIESIKRPNSARHLRLRRIRFDLFQFCEMFPVLSGYLEQNQWA